MTAGNVIYVKILSTFLIKIKRLSRCFKFLKFTYLNHPGALFLNETFKAYFNLKQYNKIADSFGITNLLYNFDFKYID